VLASTDFTVGKIASGLGSLPPPTFAKHCTAEFRKSVEEQSLSYLKYEVRGILIYDIKIIK